MRKHFSRTFESLCNHFDPSPPFQFADTDGHDIFFDYFLDYFLSYISEVLQGGSGLCLRQLSSKGIFT